MKFVVFSSGSKGNCSAIIFKSQIILIDCGIRYKHLQQSFMMRGLNISSISHVIVTHEHSDHILGLKVLLNNNPNIKTMLTKGSYIAYVEKTKHEINNKEFICPHSISKIGNISFDFFPTMHDARESVAFCLEYKDKKFSYLTDCGTINEHIIDKIKRSTHLAIEANYCVNMLADGPYPEFLKQRVSGNYGHLSNLQTSEVLKAIRHNLEYVCLMHLSENNNNPTIAYNTCKQVLNEITTLKVASQNNGAEEVIIN